MPFCYDYPRPMVTADVVLVSMDGDVPNILLVRRGTPPFKGSWALPGGFMDMHESTCETAVRELFEETGIQVEGLSQFRVYDSPGRDPRGRTVTVVYHALVYGAPPEPSPGDDAADAAWFRAGELPELAFDHARIISDMLHALGIDAGPQDTG